VPVSTGEPFHTDDSKREALGITPRELEILGLIAQGLSNREIAEKLFVSENTVKTHSSRVFDKLGAKRRTQAVQLGKELRIIPRMKNGKGKVEIGKKRASRRGAETQRRENRENGEGKMESEIESERLRHREK